MASTTKKRKTSSKQNLAVESAPLISADGWRRLRQLALLGGMLSSMYLCVAMGTFSAFDPAFSHTGAGEVTNSAGPAGAWLSDVVFQLFGYAAWSLSSLVLIFGFKLGGRSLGGWTTGLGSSILLWSIMTAIALVAPGSEESAFPPGGYFGLLSAETLLAVIGPAGAWILVVFCLLGAAPFVLGIDWENIVSGALALVEKHIPAAGRATVRRMRQASTVAFASVKSFAARLPKNIKTKGDSQVAAADRRPAIDMYTEDEVQPLDISIGLEEPAVGAVPTPTADENSAFNDLKSGHINVPINEDEPEDRTVVQLPELVEVEWGTEAGIDIEVPSQAPVPTADPISLDAALLAAAVEAPEPELAGTASDPGFASEPGLPSSSGINIEDMGPGLESEPEDAPTLPPVHEPSLSIAPITSSGVVEVTPGELISGGTNDDGRAVVVSEIRTPFELPHLNLLDSHARDVANFDELELQTLAKTLEEKLQDFGVKGEVVAIRPGPVITTFEYLPAAGIKVSKIAGLSDDIAMALKALRVRIIAPIPGKGVVGIEIPNEHRQTVWIRDMLASSTFREDGGALPMALGKTVDGKPRVADLAKMPHLLVGGTTGSGKSVGVNAMLLSLLYTRTPEELRMILVDPKMLEFEMYRDIPHLLHPVVTDPKLASAALKWACVEMDNRYRTLSQWKVRSIANYNAKLEKELEDWTPAKARQYAPPDWPENEVPPPPKRMPYLVIVIDELADLMMVAAKDVEESIIRIAQKARAAGIHLIVATQRPSVNVITGLIKANMPSRIAFQVRTKIDGRTILDQNGAEALLGKGDMLFLPPGVSALERVHGPFVSDDEVNGVTDFTRAQAQPVYEAAISANDGTAKSIDEDEYDVLYDEAVAFIVSQGKASSSMIQRQFKIGYNRAARMIEVMEQEEVVGPADGSRPRQVLVGQTG